MDILIDITNSISGFSLIFVNSICSNLKHDLLSSRGSDQEWVQSMWQTLKIDLKYQDILQKYK